MATIDIGKIKPVFKGTYDNSTAYVLDDIVYYNGSSYVAKTSTTGNLPTDTTKWNILASGSGGIWDSTLALGSAGQSVKVNSGGTALEFGTISSGTYSVHRIDTYHSTTNVSAGGSGLDYYDIAGGNTVNFTPTHADDFIYFSHWTPMHWNDGNGGDAYLMMKASSSSIGSGDTKLNYTRNHAMYTSGANDNYAVCHKSLLLPCTNLTVGTTYYVEQAGANHSTGTTDWNGGLSGGYVSGMNRHCVNMVHYKKN